MINRTLRSLVSRTISTAETVRAGNGTDTPRCLLLRDEREILRRCKKRDEDAFKDLVRLYQQRAIGLAYRLLGNRELALDVSQEAFVKAYQSIDRFDLGKNFYTWFYKIIVNLAIDHMRREYRGRVVSLGDGTELATASRNPHESVNSRETQREVWETLDSLPAKYRTILVLRDIEGLSCDEIARIIGITNEAVRWRIHKARKLFRSTWQMRDFPRTAGTTS